MVIEIKSRYSAQKRERIFGNNPQCCADYSWRCLLLRQLPLQWITMRAKLKTDWKLVYTHGRGREVRGVQHE